jgi:hypothetical protein
MPWRGAGQQSVRDSQEPVKEATPAPVPAMILQTRNVRWELIYRGLLREAHDDHLMDKVAIGPQRLMAMDSSPSEKTLSECECKPQWRDRGH